MHRWSTRTYKSLISIPPDADYLQVAVPQGGMQYPFIMSGLMAIAALDMASTSGSGAATWFRRAMELYDRSSASFRTQLSNVTPDNVEWVFAYSWLVGIINISLLPSASRSALDVALTMFDLTCGTAILAYKNMAWLLACPYGPNISYALAAYDEPPPPDALRPDLAQALARLADLVARFSASAPAPPPTEPLKVFDSPTHMYTFSVEQLHRCFTEEAKGRMAGWCTAFPAMVGPDFTAAVRRREALALLVTLHWTLLVDTLGASAWWAEGLAQTLAGEIAAHLLGGAGAGAGSGSGERVARTSEFRDSVRWVMGELERRMLDGRNAVGAASSSLCVVDGMQGMEWDCGTFEDLQNWGDNG